MEKEGVLDLSNLYGFARLYKTLVQDGGGKRSTSDMLYGCYLANISACNKNGMALQSVEPEIFFCKMQSGSVQPYKTDIQTIKALTLLEWNMEMGGPQAKEASQLCRVKTDYAQRFYDVTGYNYKDTVTSYSLCEDTLDPDNEPDTELNPAALLRRHETGPRLVYISAPLRGDMEKNIAFAKGKAREVFLEGNIPVCPHLMLPSIADPCDPVEDKAAMGMCLKLIERCSELRVYGPVWSEGISPARSSWRRIRRPVRNASLPSPSTAPSSMRKRKNASPYMPSLQIGRPCALPWTYMQQV